MPTSIIIIILNCLKQSTTGNATIPFVSKLNHKNKNQLLWGPEAPEGPFRGWDPDWSEEMIDIWPPSFWPKDFISGWGAAILGPATKTHCDVLIKMK